jgi:hypothetical protein
MGAKTRSSRWKQKNKKIEDLFVLNVQNIFAFILFLVRLLNPIHVLPWHTTRLASESGDFYKYSLASPAK